MVGVGGCGEGVFVGRVFRQFGRKLGMGNVGCVRVAILMCCALLLGFRSVGDRKQNCHLHQWAQIFQVVAASVSPAPRLGDRFQRWNYAHQGVEFGGKRLAARCGGLQASWEGGCVPALEF